MNKILLIIAIVLMVGCATRPAVNCIDGVHKVVNHADGSFTCELIK